MKLLYCPTCTDIRKLHVGVRVVCLCGESAGAYQANGRWVQLSGPSKLLTLQASKMRGMLLPESSPHFRRD